MRRIIFLKNRINPEKNEIIFQKIANFSHTNLLPHETPPVILSQQILSSSAFPAPVAAPALDKAGLGKTLVLRKYWHLKHLVGFDCGEIHQRTRRTEARMGSSLSTQGRGGCEKNTSPDLWRELKKKFIPLLKNIAFCIKLWRDKNIYIRKRRCVGEKINPLTSDAAAPTCKSLQNNTT